MSSFTFADIFAGIGGFRLAAEQLGGRCVFTSEIKKSAIRVYTHYFGETDFLDITKVDLALCEKPDLVLAGWPCQPFSATGYRRGFQDADNGELFFHLTNYLDSTKAPYFLFENVRNYATHDKGRTLEITYNTLLDLGYTVHYKVIKASEMGLPQHRPRVYFVGYKGEEEFSWPPPQPLLFSLSHVLKGECNKEIAYTLREGGYDSPIDDRHNWNRYYVDGKDRGLTFAEAKLLQGFPQDFSLPEGMSDKIGIQLLGNSVAVSVIKMLLTQLLFVRERQIGKNIAH
jgi:DNA (cytosine-5)-methyltransferase 1